MGKEQNRFKGKYYEQTAAVFLQRQGYEILKTNYQTRFGEIDLIGRDGAYLTFIEVKYRSNNRMGAPEEAVDAKKQAKIYRCAQVYLMENKLEETVLCRFDVVAIAADRIRLWKHAFGGM